MSKLVRAGSLLMVWVPSALAQGRELPPIADSSAVQIMARVGGQAGAWWLQDVLRQSSAEYPQAKLDEIADSLVARAIDPASVHHSDDAYRRGTDALLALMQASRPPHDPSRGKPYHGAFERLVTIHRRAPSSNIRAKALAGLLVASHSRAVDYLCSVAESSDATSYDAIYFLIMAANGGSWTGTQPTPAQQRESVSALKALESRRRVTDGGAAKLLGLWIAQNRSAGPPNDR